MDKIYIADLQRIYEEAYKKEWEARKGTSPIRVVERENPLDDNSKVVKVYENEGNFFLCGFQELRFSYKGQNRKLKKLLKEQGIESSRAYGGGVAFNLKQIGNRGNGDHEIQCHAYGAVSNYLDSLGFETYVWSRLD